MKRLVLAIIVLLLSTMTYAQQKPYKTAEERANMHTQKMTEKLGLTQEQQKKVYDINLANAKKMDELRDANAATRDSATMVTGVQKIESEKEAALKAVLTEQQFNDYVAWKKEKKDKMKEYQKDHDDMPPTKRDTL